MSMQLQREVNDLKQRVATLEQSLAELRAELAQRAVHASMPTSNEPPLDPNKPSVFGSILKRK